MGRTSRVLRTYGAGGYMFWCPGCNDSHSVNVTSENGPRWSFNGNFEKPTFFPSVLCFTSYSETEENPDGSPKKLPGGQRRTLCHLFVRDGMLDFCGDSPHHLAGQIVPMADLPDRLRDEATQEGT